jgi:phage terminase large subunit-like protein
MTELEKCMELLPNYNIWETASEGEYFDESKAEFMIAFFETHLKHVKGPLVGQNIKLEDWQKGFLAAVYGWRRADGTRRFREVMLYIARKNGKTIIAAGIGLGELYCGEPGSETYVAASTRDQSSICWKMAEQMIKKNPELDKRVKIYTALKSFEKEDGSIFKPVASDGGALHGLNASVALVDELHTFSPTKGFELLEALSTSMGVRKEPLMMYLTTSDSERPGSLCNERHDYACKVRDGIIKDSSFLPVIYEASKEDDWTDPEVWKKSNPNLGVSVTQEFLERECKKAQSSPIMENSFKRLYLNIRTEQDERWISMDDYDKCEKHPLDLLPEDLKGRRCFAGFDLASVSDLTSFNLVFPDDGYAILNFNWLPKLTAHKREEKNGIAYLNWAREGFITLTEGNVADYDVIREDINKLGDIYNIEQIATDPWGASDIMTKLGHDGFEIVAFRQGFGSMSAPTKEFDRLMRSQALCHFGNPVHRWAASNAAAETDPAGNIKISKKKSNEKIDPMIATIMAIGLCIIAEQEQTSVYETRGVMTF